VAVVSALAAPAHRAAAGRRMAARAFGLLLAGLLGVLGSVLVLAPPPDPSCGAADPAAADGAASAAISAAAIALAAPAGGTSVGATEYGGPGDPSSGTVGSSGVNLLAHPDSFAELGGTSFATATALGGLAYLTALRITWGAHSAVAYKRDIGLGGGPIDGHPRAIDLWWQFAGALGIPYEAGRWSGVVHISRATGAGAAPLLGAASVAPGAPTPACAAGAPGDASGAENGSGPPDAAVAPVTAGPRAQLLSDGLAAAPAGAPAAVRGIIAAGNQIAGRPYLYGAAHGTPLDQLAPAYDCSSSVEHLLYGGGLLPVDYGAASGALESFGLPGPGRWVTIYANPTHVFLYVAGLRWDTWNAAGPADGTSGIGWHPLVRDASGFVARHPVGL
jgi:hypothetical protein